MPRDRHRSIRRGSPSNRRGVLKTAAGATILLGTAVGLLSTRSISAVRGTRSAAVDVASAENAILGIEGQGPVKKNQRDPMVMVSNNSTASLSITVTLADCSQGTLFDNEGGSGCSVTFDVASGNAQYVDIQATVTGTIAYTVVGSSPSMRIETTGSIESEAGNTPGAVLVHKPNKDQDFTADPQFNEFTLKSVDVRDEDGDADLDRIEFRVRESASPGTVIASKDVTNPPGDRYAPTGNPAETIVPNPGYTISANTAYSLTVRGVDVDGNYDSATVEDTA